MKVKKGLLAIVVATAIASNTANAGWPVFDASNLMQAVTEFMQMQKDYQAAITSYTQAINIEPDFAEAYFNRALTYLLLNQRDKTISDLSKAGELGIYKAYSILKKIQNQ